MTIDRLILENFKCFNRANVALAPMTLLTGFNAGGKSTTLQALLLLAQGFRYSPDSKFLPLNGPIIKLGNAGEVIRQGGGRYVRFGVQGYNSQAEWDFSAGHKDVSADEAVDSLYGRERLEVTSSTGVHDESDSSASLLSKASQLTRAIRDIIYLSATRHTQLDIFPFPEDAEPVHADVGNQGQFAPWWYVQTADNEVREERRCPGNESVTVRAQIDAWLDFLFPGASANAETVAGTGYARLEFKVGRSGAWSRPSNIGYGLSYVFPLIVASINARPGQILIVDSPEAHLHPRAQSQMGRMLAAFAASGVQILVESHSDHVLSGLRLAVRDQTLSGSSLAVHFFSSRFEDGLSGIISPAVTANGDLSDWPEGFFDQADIDLSQLAEY